VTVPADEFAGQGGSYELLPDGTRRLLFRTGVGEVAASPAPAEEPLPLKPKGKDQ
jgi:hypothetical protein